MYQKGVANKRKKVFQKKENYFYPRKSVCSGDSVVQNDLTQAGEGSTKNAISISILKMYFISDWEYCLPSYFFT